MARKHKIRPRFSAGAMNERQNSASEDIEIQREKAVAQSIRRKETFISILSNTPSDESNSLKYMIYGLGSIVVAFLPSLVITLVPSHNVILSPQYWYEFLLQFGFAILPCFAGNMLLRSSYYMNMKYMLKVILQFSFCIGLTIKTPIEQ